MAMLMHWYNNWILGLCLFLLSSFEFALTFVASEFPSMGSIFACVLLCAGQHSFSFYIFPIYVGICHFSIIFFSCLHAVLSYLHTLCYRYSICSVSSASKKFQSSFILDCQKIPHLNKGCPNKQYVLYFQIQ